MDSVKRYNADKNSLLSGMSPADNGGWVRYDDYARLAAENAALRAALNPSVSDWPATIATPHPESV